MGHHLPDAEQVHLDADGTGSGRGLSGGSGRNRSPEGDHSGSEELRDLYPGQVEVSSRTVYGIQIHRAAGRPQTQHTLSGPAQRRQPPEGLHL